MWFKTGEEQAGKRYRGAQQQLPENNRESGIKEHKTQRRGKRLLKYVR